MQTTPNCMQQISLKYYMREFYKNLSSGFGWSWTRVTGTLYDSEKP
jgi:hypothetical protein